MTFENESRGCDEIREFSDFSQNALNSRFFRRVFQGQAENLSSNIVPILRM